MLLQDKVVVVTGGGRALGRTIAEAVVAAGAAVVICGRAEDALAETVAAIRAAGGEAGAVVADVSIPADVERLRDEAQRRHGHVDVLVNNSGIAGPSKPLWQIDPDEWDETMNVNVRGVFLACRAFLPGMLERGSGSVVTIGSMTGKRPLFARTPYATSKTALIGLTRTLAQEVGPRGIRVNLVSPGGVAGDRLDGAIANLADAEGITPEQARARFVDPSPLGRVVAPEDVANAVVFLASDGAASITGEDLNVSAGVVTY